MIWKRGWGVVIYLEVATQLGKFLGLRSTYAEHNVWSWGRGGVNNCLGYYRGIDNTQTRHRQGLDKTQTRHRQGIDTTQTRNRQDIDKTRHIQHKDKTYTTQRQGIDNTQTTHRQHIYIYIDTYLFIYFNTFIEHVIYCVHLEDLIYSTVHDNKQHIYCVYLLIGRL